MSAGSCLACGGFVGETGKVYGYAGKWCQCTAPKLRATPNLRTIAERIDWMQQGEDQRAQQAQPLMNPCGCIGPQRGQPLCPCAMRGVVIKNGRYVRPEIDLGPAPQGTP